MTEENFEEVMERAAGPVLLEVYAPWCAHCRALEYHWNKLAILLKEEGSAVTVARMDGWQNEVPPHYRQAFGGSGVPRVYLLLPQPGGRRSVEQYDGEKDYEPILDWVHVKVAA